jgi:hypothetical protein
MLLLFEIKYIKKLLKISIFFFCRSLNSSTAPIYLSGEKRKGWKKEEFPPCPNEPQS